MAVTARIAVPARVVAVQITDHIAAGKMPWAAAGWDPRINTPPAGAFVVQTITYGLKVTLADRCTL